MKGVEKYIAIGHKTTTVRSSSIHICLCNRNDGTAKPIFENHESSNDTANIHSLFIVNGNIEHGNIHRYVTPTGDHPSRNSI